MVANLEQNACSAEVFGFYLRSMERLPIFAPSRESPGSFRGRTCPPQCGTSTRTKTTRFLTLKSISRKGANPFAAG